MANIGINYLNHVLLQLKLWKSFTEYSDTSEQFEQGVQNLTGTVEPVVFRSAERNLLK